MRAHLPLTLSVALVAACGDDSAVVTDTDSQTTTGSTTGPGTTTDITPTEPGTTTTTTTGDTATGTTGTTTEQVTVSETSSGTTTTTDTGESTTSESSSTTADTTTTGTTGTTDDTTGTTTGTTGTTADTTTTGTTADTTTTTSTGTDTDTDTSDSSSTGDDTGGPVEEGLGYVGLSGSSNSLVIFDPKTKQVVGAPISLLPHASYPYDAMLTPDGSELWVVGAVGDGVKVVDTASGQLVQQIDLTGIGEYPVNVLFSLDGARAYVSSRDSDALVLLDTATYTVDKAVAVPAGMEGGKAAIDPCTGVVHLVDWYESNLIRFDPMTEAMTSKPLGDSLWDLRIDPAGATMYVTDRGLDVVHVLDVATLEVQATVSVGNDPWGIDITSDGALVVVACEDDSTVHFIDAAALTTTSLALPAGADPRDVDISLDDARAYVPTGDIPGNDGVYEIDLATQSLTGLIDFGIATNTNIVAVTPQSVTCDP